MAEGLNELNAAPLAGPLPPPMPVGQLFAEDNSAEQDRSKLFAELNKGDNATKGLKKVTSDMQTHKNPALRGSPAPPLPVRNQQDRPTVTQIPPDKPPRKHLEGKKWVVGYHKNVQDLMIDETEMNQSVYIYKCEGTTVQVKGKVSSIAMDSCKKTNLVFDSVIASVEVINCRSIQMQVLDKVPTITVDSTEGCQIYLNQSSLDVAIVTAKSSETNILVPKSDGDLDEYHVPEQIKTSYNGKSMVSAVFSDKA